MKRSIIRLCSLALLGLFCMGSFVNCSSSGTTSTEDSSDDSSDAGSDSSDTGSNSSTDDNGTSTTSGTVQNLETTPCTTPYAQLALSDSTLVIGCELGEGLHISTDGGATFNEIDMSGVLNGSTNDFDIYDLVAASSTTFYICGQDNAVPGVYLWLFDTNGNNVSTLFTADDTDASYDHCESMAKAGDTIVLAELNGTDIVYSNDGGATWNDSAETSSVKRLTVNGDTIFGIGGTLSAGQVFMWQDGDTGFTEIDLGLSEGRAIAIGSDERVLIGGGGGAGEGYIIYADGEVSFSQATLNNSVALFRVEAIICPAEDTCFAVAQSNNNKTYMYKSIDNGTTWTELAETSDGLPYDITASDTYVFVATDNGDLFKITI